MMGFFHQFHNELQHLLVRRFQALADRFGHHSALVDSGLDIAWPPIDTARRDAT
jgi:hypothetical protein